MQSAAISLLQIAGRHRGNVEEAEVPARKNDRALRDFSDFVNSLKAGWTQAQKVQNATDSGKSPGWCDFSKPGLPFPPSVDSLRSYFQQVMWRNLKNIMLNGRS